MERIFSYYRDGEWFPVPAEAVTENGFLWETDGARFEAKFWEGERDGEICYSLSMKAPWRAKLKMTLRAPGEEEYFHLIPCNIYGDNQADLAKPGEFPLLTHEHPELAFCSPRWEFRADRAAMPVSMLCTIDGVYGVSVDPYSETADGYIRNGVFAELPDRLGVTLGYTNDPVTVLNKQTWRISRGDSAQEAAVQGRLYRIAGRGRAGAHRIIRREYEQRHERAVYGKSPREAAQAMFDCFVRISWDEEEREYTNKSCRIPDNTKLRPWRIVPEIGWTGGGVLAYPLELCRQLLGRPDFGAAITGEEIIERILAGYNEASGLFFDLTRPAADGSRVNGWWTGYGLVRDCHCAYNVGSALYYILKTIALYRETGREVPAHWLTVSKKVMDTVLKLQREDGAFGYTYRTDRRAVQDWEGFAGCWFAPCAAYFYSLTGECSYLEAAKRALCFYGKQVRALCCCGTPMDTWKSVDEEGNLAFVRGCRLVYDLEPDAEILELFCLGAEYEYLWRYGYRTRPEHAPLNDGWNACGGSVTSVSNPHIHPMGVLIDEDLRRLAEITGDDYHKSRAEDSFAWLMQTLELYPEKTGYGAYGILSERWCPSDGLVVEEYSDGRKYSSWFSYNLWAAANALEAVCERMRSE